MLISRVLKYLQRLAGIVNRLSMLGIAGYRSHLSYKLACVFFALFAIGIMAGGVLAFESAGKGSGNCYASCAEAEVSDRGMVFFSDTDGCERLEVDCFSHDTEEEDSLEVVCQIVCNLYVQYPLLKLSSIHPKHFTKINISSYIQLKKSVMLQI